MTGAVWLSFDLGFKGDYDTLYAWLDSKRAKECGDSVAFFTYSFKKNLKDELKKEIRKIININTNPRARAYIVYLDSGDIKGSFIIGKRKAAPWEGYAPSEGEEEMDESSV
ncbi:MAG: hypothetical protein ABSG42_06295 [Nitrospirota bacterium]